MPATVPPFQVLAKGSLSPLVLTCEHASRRLPVTAPRSAALGKLLRSHWGWDIGGWELTRELSRRLGAGAIGGRWSRLYIDLNRKVDDPTLIRPVAEGLRLPWNARLGVREIERRILAIHAPYHAEVDRLILRRVVRGVRPLVLAVHTFTPLLDGERRDFDLGVLYRDHTTQALRLGRRCAELGLTVRYNQPYSGIAGLMYAAERHGLHHGLPCLELELNQGLFERRGAAARLGRLLARAIGELLAR